tara:strand:- start:395 stop:982 length:588 start_codon:yes stop_codon:yes gene_type:complete
MTAITALENIHKKGIFGDHQEKHENELLKISEVKGLTILQVVKYKKAEIELENIKIEGLIFPKENSTVISNNETRILWSAPRTWLIVSTNEKIVDKIKKNCSPKDFAITDISHSRAVIQINGHHAREVLKKGCPININELKKNSCAGTVFQGITILVDCLNTDPDTFNLFALRSFGESFYHHISDSALEFGYVGI